jgi:hypothetical protein
MSSDTQGADRGPIRWHYTTGQNLGSILASGELRPAAPRASKGGKPVVWFSTSPDWDPSANLSRRGLAGAIERLSKDQTLVVGGGLVRIGVAPETAPHDWNAYKQRSGVAPKLAKQIYDAAIKLGARPGQWFASFAPVPRDKWLAIEVFEDDRWVVRPG